jgi:hypothetical protein
MLTSAQKSRCAKLAAALDTGDYETYRRAEPALSPAMKGLIWDLRTHVVAAGGRGRKQTLLRNHSKVSRPEAAVMRDLDYWSDTDDEPDDDPGDDPMPCAACDGTGRDAAGNRCATCNGTGKAPLDDDDENEDDE